MLMSRYPPLFNDCYPNFSPLYTIALLIVFFVAPMIILLWVNVAIMLELRKRVLKMNLHHTNRRRFAAVTAIAAVVPVTTIGDSRGGVNLSSSGDLTGEEIQQQKISQTNSAIVVKNMRVNISREKKAIIALAFIQISLIVCWAPYITILPMVCWFFNFWLLFILYLSCFNCILGLVFSAIRSRSCILFHGIFVFDY